MKRRTYLRSLGVAGTAGVVGTAGCLDTFDQALSDDDSRTILPPADGHPDDPGYPSHGNEFPSFSIPDPIAETNVSLEDFVGERSFLLTYFFTTCPDGVCPALLTRLRWAQDDAIDRGYADDLGLLAFTFDPERDTPEVLTEYATRQNIEYDAENFHFLRPESYEEAKRLMTDTFGMALQREEDGENGEDESNGTEGTNESNESADGNGSHDGNESHNETESHDEHDHGAYTFTHNSRITLVNEDGIVERAYPSAVQSERAVDRKRLLEETRTVVGVE